MANPETVPDPAPRPVICGIYMLFSGHELAYVGKSVDCYSRIATHRTNGREFDYATVTACPEADVGWIEKALIKAFEPRQNRVGKAPEVQPIRLPRVVYRDADEARKLAEDATTRAEQDVREAQARLQCVRGSA